MKIFSFQGHIELASVVFPNGVKGHMIDSLGEQGKKLHLWVPVWECLDGYDIGLYILPRST